MLLERFEHLIRHRVHIREVKTQDQVFPLLSCRGIRNAASAEYFFETVFPVDIIIPGKHINQ